MAKKARTAKQIAATKKMIAANKRKRGAKAGISRAIPNPAKHYGALRRKAAGHPKAGKPGVTCAHCKKPIAGHPVSHHSEGKPSKHYHSHHAKHHKAAMATGALSHDALVVLVKDLANDASTGWINVEVPEHDADYMTRSAREHAVAGAQSDGERLWHQAIEALKARDYPTARAILHDVGVIEDNWVLPDRYTGKANKAFSAILQFEKDHGIYVEASGEEARTRLARKGQQWMRSPSDFEEYGDED